MTTGNWTWGGVRNTRSRWRVVGLSRSSAPEGRSLRHLEWLSVVVGWKIPGGVKRGVGVMMSNAWKGRRVSFEPLTASGFSARGLLWCTDLWMVETGHPTAEALPACLPGVRFGQCSQLSADASTLTFKLSTGSVDSLPAGRDGGIETYDRRMTKKQVRERSPVTHLQGPLHFCVPSTLQNVKASSPRSFHIPSQPHPWDRPRYLRTRVSQRSPRYLAIYTIDTNNDAEQPSGNFEAKKQWT